LPKANILDVPCGHGRITVEDGRTFRADYRFHIAKIRPITAAGSQPACASCSNSAPRKLEQTLADVADPSKARSQALADLAAAVGDPALALGTGSAIAKPTDICSTP
jgi:hypothetical protein